MLHDGRRLYDIVAKIFDVLQEFVVSVRPRPRFRCCDTNVDFIDFWVHGN